MQKLPESLQQMILLASTPGRNRKEGWRFDGFDGFYIICLKQAN
jgi:hypothetical protein